VVVVPDGARWLNQPSGGGGGSRKVPQRGGGTTLPEIQICELSKLKMEEEYQEEEMQEMSEKDTESYNKGFCQYYCPMLKIHLIFMCSLNYYQVAAVLRYWRAIWKSLVMKKGNFIALESLSKKETRKSAISWINSVHIFKKWIWQSSYLQLKFGSRNPSCQGKKN